MYGAARPHTQRPLGREGAPLGNRIGASLFVSLAGDEVALLIEMVVDLSMNGSRIFAASSCFETAAWPVLVVEMADVNSPRDC